ncbi:MAG: hypothetical protein A2934_00610 [Candidatus Sungbacteria bacterium RIFCSPLOWO2_01_FULL_47_10]|uniref:O-antigen ligase-related domain-containing protein n=1 Tax=Candidatus Sungbacteria bacterium RIFCSPLOWO2_01_FULL_47_10 TaxID=1802276 RepID=A0A1G2L5B4_9BACT|nr:MAG: hypothetical protein A2934_00610 [Candidatus Sungbacteria bacterium RIFCSPLOWO2_01_FULL_47_10]
MSYKFLQNVYIWLIRIGLFIVPFLSLYISSDMLFPYITGRNFSFRIITEIVFVLWVGLAVLNTEYLPKPSKLLLTVFAFVGVVGLADALGVNPYRSFFSNYERMEGFMMIFHMALYFLVLTSVFKTKKEWLWYFGVIIAASVFVAFNALLQRLGVYQSLQGGTRVDGTIGNPTYLAAYLMFSFFLSFVLFRALEKFIWKYVLLVTAGFALIIIFFTATRGATLALIGGGILFSVLSVLFIRAETERQRIFKKISLAGLGVLILVPVIGYLVRDTALIQKSSTLARLTNIRLSERTVSSRFLIWEMALAGVKERPILGWGQENFAVIFSKYYNPQLFAQEPWFDRSHNIFFDWLVNAGILGLLSYLSLFAVSFFVLWQLGRAGIVAVREAILLAVMLASYFAQNIFVFDNFNTYYVFFGILAYINFNSNSLSPVEPEVLRSSPVARKNINRSMNLAVPKSLSYVVAFGVFMLVFLYVFNIKPLNQSRALIDALRSGAQGVSAIQVLDNFKKALSYNSFGTSEVREQLAQFGMGVYRNTSVPEDQRNEIAKFAVQEMEQQARDISGDVKYKLFLANLYMTFVPADPSYDAMAEAILLEALTQSPTKQPIYFTLAQYYFNKGDVEKTLAISQQAVELAPNYIDAQVNLAMVAIYARKKEIVEKILVQLENTIETNDKGSIYGKVTSYPKIISALSQVGDFERIPHYYEQLIEIDPRNIQFQVGAAYTYAKLGKKDEAIAAARKAAEIDPANYTQPAEQLIQMLESGQTIP